MAEDRQNLAGNRWVLVGGVVYLLEWVAIIGTGMVGLGSVVTRGLTEAELVESYGGQVDAASFMAGWFAVVLLGRILVFVGLRRALTDSGHAHPLMDLAVVASAVSVTLEVARRTAWRWPPPSGPRQGTGRGWCCSTPPAAAST